MSDAPTTLLGGAGDTPASAPAAAPAAAPVSAPSFVNPDGSFADNWLESLPPDIRTSASLAPIKNIGDLAKSYVHTKGMVGKRLEAPGADATPEQLAEWRKIVGVPADLTGYLGDAKTLRPEGLAEDMWDAKAENDFLTIAHKHHIPPAAVKEILGFYGANLQQSLQGMQEQQQASLTAETAKLKEAWGAEFPTKAAAVQRLAATIGLDPTTDPIFANASYVQAFEKMARLVSEDKLVKGEHQSLSGSLAERARDITDPKSTTQEARAYRGELGPHRQQEVQAILHGIWKSQSQAA